MKVLYAAQATGNGHLARALQMVPALQERMNLDVLVSGHQSDLSLPFPVKYKKRGISYVCNADGKIDIGKSIAQVKLGRFVRDLQQFPRKEYDFIINDFEPLSAWASKIYKIPSIALSHQSSFLFPNVPLHPDKSWTGSFVLKQFAPATDHIGLHFKRYHQNILEPIIRREVRSLHTTSGAHYNVYLPFYATDLLVQEFSKLAPVPFHIYSKKAEKASTVNNCTIHPISSEGWLAHLASCKGVIMGAGFEGPSECLYLGKKLMVIPLKGQYEQKCNAFALEQLGVKTLTDFDENFITRFAEWQKMETIHIDYPDHTAEICDRILEFGERSGVSSAPSYMISSNVSS